MLRFRDSIGQFQQGDGSAIQAALRLRLFNRSYMSLAAFPISWIDASSIAVFTAALACALGCQYHV